MHGKVSKNGIGTNSNDISVVDAVNYSYDSKILNESLPLTYTFLAEKVEEPTAGTKGMGIAGVESSYYYDTENDKLLSVGEAAEALEMKLDGLTSRDGKVLNTYNDLDECNDYMIVIGENGLEL